MFLDDLASALDTAHRSGLVHGGVKASNVFVCASPGWRPGKALWLDFGVHHVYTRRADAHAASDLAALAMVVRNLLVGEDPSGRDATPLAYMTAIEEIAGDARQRKFKTASDLMSRVRLALGGARAASARLPVGRLAWLQTRSKSEQPTVSAREGRPGELNAGLGSTTRSEVPSRTALARQRLGTLRATNQRAVNQLERGIRLHIDAENDRSLEDSAAKRCAAAAELVGSLETVLLDRMKRALADANVRVSWRMQTPPRPLRGQPDRRRISEKRMLDVVTGCDRDPSLWVLATWIAEPLRLVPEELALSVQEHLGVPPGLEAELLCVGGLRNVLAHRSAYIDSTRSLGDCEGLVVRAGDGVTTFLDVPPATLEWLQWVSSSVIARQLRERPSWLG